MTKETGKNNQDDDDKSKRPDGQTRREFMVSAAAVGTGLALTGIPSAESEVINDPNTVTIQVPSPPSIDSCRVDRQW